MYFQLDSQIMLRLIKHCYDVNFRAMHYMSIFGVYTILVIPCKNFTVRVNTNVLDIPVQ